ncbi:MAG TPA: hypothetical protein DDW52_11345 [Planctomycetaceae bacterium]|nr:hypothetical protein [Planctomycetaceae bacterium]
MFPAHELVDYRSSNYECHLENWRSAKECKFAAGDRSIVQEVSSATSIGPRSYDRHLPTDK